MPDTDKKYRIYEARHTAHRDVENLIKANLGSFGTTFNFFANRYASERSKERYRRELEKIALQHSIAADKYWQKMLELPLPAQEET
jgi:hypothetical protein